MKNTKIDIEKLAELEHKQWISWSKNIAKTEKITPARLKQWKMLWKPYDSLTEAEKNLDRKWADKIIKILKFPNQCTHDIGFFKITGWDSNYGRNEQSMVIQFRVPKKKKSWFMRLCVPTEHGEVSQTELRNFIERGFEELYKKLSK